MHGQWGIWDVTEGKWMHDPLRAPVNMSPARYASPAEAERHADRDWRELNPDRMFVVRPLVEEGAGVDREEFARGYRQGERDTASGAVRQLCVTEGGDQPPLVKELGPVYYHGYKAAVESGARDEQGAWAAYVAKHGMHANIGPLGERAVAHSRMIAAAEVSGLPIGSILWADSANEHWVVVPGGVAPISLLSERAGRPPPEGEPAEWMAKEFALISEGKGRVPTHGTAERHVIAWVQAAQRAHPNPAHLSLDGKLTSRLGRQDASHIGFDGDFSFGVGSKDDSHMRQNAGEALIDEGESIRSHMPGKTTLSLATLSVGVPRRRRRVYAVRMGIDDRGVAMGGFHWIPASEPEEAERFWYEHTGRRVSLGGSMRRNARYWSVVIPWSDSPTRWHPTEPTGPFATLTRGSFQTEEEAHRWAAEHLEGQPYSVRQYGYDEPPGYEGNAKGDIIWQDTLLTWKSVGKRGIEMVPSEEGRARAQEMLEARESGHGQGPQTDQADFLEIAMGNGWDYVPPEDIGALTDATIVSEDGFNGDDGKWYPHPDVEAPVVYAHMNYAVEDPIETWAEGKPVFWKADVLEVSPEDRVMLRRKYAEVSGEAYESNESRDFLWTVSFQASSPQRPNLYVTQRAEVRAGSEEGAWQAGQLEDEGWNVRERVGRAHKHFALNARKNVSAVIDAFLAGRRHSEKTCSTDGERIYSYSLPIAARLENGHVVVLDKARSPSSTTSSQINAVLSAIPSAETVDAIPGEHEANAGLDSDGWGETNVKRWMRSHVVEYVDARTGEVNITQLAEDAAYEASRAEWLDDDTHPIWDWAIEAAEMYKPNAEQAANMRGSGEVIESKIWRHRSGRTASPYGAAPWTGAPGDRESDWELESAGWTIRWDDGTVGTGQRPARTREEAEARLARIMARRGSAHAPNRVFRHMELPEIERILGPEEIARVLSAANPAANARAHASKWWEANDLDLHDGYTNLARMLKAGVLDDLIAEAHGRH